MRRQGTVDFKNKYSDNRKGSMTPKDYEQAKKYGERAKQKYLKEKRELKKSNDVPTLFKHQARFPKKSSLL